MTLSVRAGVCSGSGPCDSSPLGEDPNWVTKAGGLDPYVRAIARALQRDQGMPESQAIATAINSVKHWAGGGGKVSATTRARAAAAVAAWEKLKASGHGNRTVARDNAAYRAGVADRKASRPQMGPTEFAEFNPGSDADDYPLYQAGYAADETDLTLQLRPHVRAASGGAVPDESPATDTTAYRQGLKDKASGAALQTLTLWMQRNPGADSEAYPDYLAGFTADAATVAFGGLRPPGNPTPIDALQSALAAYGYRAGTRDLGGVAEWGNPGPPTPDASGSATLLPVVQPRKPAPRQATGIDETIPRHRFRGTNLEHCQECGKPVGAAVHRRVADAPTTGARHAGFGHHPVTSGHIKGDTRRRAKAAKAAHDTAAASLEQPLAEAMQRFFSDQRTSTLARLNGKRGKQMLKRAGVRAADPQGDGPRPGQPPPVPAQTGRVQPAGRLPPIDPAAVFDQSYWNDRLAGILRPYHDAAGVQAAANVRRHLELPGGFDDTSSLGAVRQLLETRGNQTSPQINADTYDQIVKELQAGVAAGEGQQALAGRVNAVFDTADRVRARRIAQTEVQAALNGSANAYADRLPPAVVGSKRWLAHHDDRVRDAHRIADGQTVPTGFPFYVGGYPMQYPGDPVAPPDLTVNCRCGLMFLPPGMDNGNLIFAAAKKLHADAAKAAGVTLSPAAQQFIAS